MEDPRKKWDAIYSDGKGVPSNASGVLEENRHLLPRDGEALEIACGLAGNAVLLARAGLSVRAWDISPVVIGQVNAYARDQGLKIEGEARDVCESPPGPESCDVVVVAHFLDRTMIPHLVEALRPGGLVFYQTFTRSKISDTGPSNPDFLLAEGELLRLFGDLDLLVYREEGLVGDTTRGLRNEAMIVARKPGQ